MHLLNDETLNAFQKDRKKMKKSILTAATLYWKNWSVSAVRHGKEIKDINIENGKLLYS